IIVFVSAMIMPNNWRRVQNAKFAKAVMEMKSIALASIDYLESKGTCPADISELAPAFMPRAVTSSPFGTAYQINCTSNMLSVSNLVPAGMAVWNPEGPLLQISSSGGQDNVTITQTVPNTFVARLLYDKRYLYSS
ncbi:MAG: hypothetical protein KGJ11_10230, partial [Candidatus Omnitrophica bacterium]|nr:hypothetical protein [Candidatus Omnitrophota bacterium]